MKVGIDIEEVVRIEKITLNEFLLKMKFCIAISLVTRLIDSPVFFVQRKRFQKHLEQVFQME